MPGCGESDRPPTGEDGDALPPWIEAGAAALGLDSFDLVGFSFGAMVAGFYAALYPQRVKRLVLVGAPGFNRTPGPKANLREWLRLPDGLTLREAALSYLPSWSVSALHLGRYAAAETVVVTGLGLVGCSAALVADRMGARVLGLDIDPVRVAHARDLDLGAVAQLGTDDGSDAIAAYLGAGGPDLVLETTGSWAGLGEAIRLARDYTRIAVMGIYRTPPPPELGLSLHAMLTDYPAKLHYGRLSFIGVGSDPDEVAAPSPSLATTRTNHAWVLEQAARGRLPLDRLITDQLPPAAIGDALERLAARESRMVGIVFDWGAETE